MNAGRRRIWWSSCPTSPHRANIIVCRKKSQVSPPRTERILFLRVRLQNYFCKARAITENIGTSKPASHIDSNIHFRRGRTDAVGWSPSVAGKRPTVLVLLATAAATGPPARTLGPSIRDDYCCFVESCNGDSTRTRNTRTTGRQAEAVGNRATAGTGLGGPSRRRLEECQRGVGPGATAWCDACSTAPGRPWA